MSKKQMVLGYAREQKYTVACIARMVRNRGRKMRGASEVLYILRKLAEEGQKVGVEGRLAIAK